jgi:PAS domain-containing protein
MDILKDYLEVIIASAAVIGILLKLYFWLRKQWKDVSDVHSMVRTIFSEITPNSGTSIKDKINCIERDLSDQNISIEKITRRQFWLLENEQRLIFETDAEGKFLWINKRFKDLIKRDLSFVEGNGWKNVVHDDDRDEVIDKFQSCIKDGITYEDVFRICDSNRNVFKVKCIANKADECGYMGTIILLDNNVFF